MPASGILCSPLKPNSGLSGPPKFATCTAAGVIIVVIAHLHSARPAHFADVPARATQANLPPAAPCACGTPGTPLGRRDAAEFYLPHLPKPGPAERDGAP